MAAKNGSVSFVGRSGQIYSPSIYLDDTTEHLANWSTYGVAAATNDNRFKVQEDCVLTDVIVDAATAITKIGVLRNGMPTGNYMTVAGRLAAVASRPALRVPFKKDDHVQIVQYT